MAKKAEPVPMKRFWFTTYRENPLFHATPECHRLENVTDDRDLNQLPVAHIPVDASKVGRSPDLNFCDHCGNGDPFE